MKSSLAIALFCLAAAASASSPRVRYDGYKVFRVVVDSEESGRFLGELNVPGLEFWTDLRVAATADVMVPPGGQRAFLAALDSRGIGHSVMIEDVEALASLTKMNTAPDAKMDWETYHTLDTIYAYLDLLEGKGQSLNLSSTSNIWSFPETYEFVSTEVIGQSYEGRDMRVIKICRSGNCGDKPGMYIEGGTYV